MSNRKIVLVFFVWAVPVLVLALWARWEDSKHCATPIARADSTLAARPIGRAGFVKVDSPVVKFTGRLTGENVLPTQKNVFWIFTDCIPDTGDLLYPARVNDSLVVMVWLNPNLVKQ